MPKITYIDHFGKSYSVDAEVGQSLMQVAINNQIPGVIGDCGGNCACATCHGYIEPPWAEHLKAAQSTERDMLHCAQEVNPSSRLLCQVIMSDALDGLEVKLPSRQN